MSDGVVDWGLCLMMGKGWLWVVLGGCDGCDDDDE